MARGSPQGHERAAILLFRKYHRGGTAFPDLIRWVAVDTVLLDDDWCDCELSVSHRNQSCANSLRFICAASWRGYLLDLCIATQMACQNSRLQTIKTRKNILRGYGGCNGPDVSLVCLVLCAGEGIGRVRHASQVEAATKVRHVAVLGQKLQLHLGQTGALDPALQRQEAAFGEPFNAKLKSLRVCVIGWEEPAHRLQPCFLERDVV